MEGKKKNLRRAFFPPCLDLKDILVVGVLLESETPMVISLAESSLSSLAAPGGLFGQALALSTFLLF